MPADSADELLMMFGLYNVGYIDAAIDAISEFWSDILINNVDILPDIFPNGVISAVKISS